MPLLYITFPGTKISRYKLYRRKTSDQWSVETGGQNKKLRGGNPESSKDAIF